MAATQLNFRPLTDFELRPIHWLWYPYIPRGTVSVLIGSGGLGKSWITCSLAAHLSRGERMPFSTNPPDPSRHHNILDEGPRNVLVASAEDDPSEVMLPRMLSMNANMARISVEPKPFTLDTAGIAALKQSIRQVDATILFIDPLVSYIGGKIDMNRANEVRAMMGPLVEAAKDTNSAIVLVHHTRKAGTAKDATDALGSVDFANSARSVMLVQPLADNTCVMRHAKSNWGPKGPTLQYELVSGSFAWLGPIEEDSRKARAISSNSNIRKRAAELLFDMLRDGARPTAEIVAEGKANGINPRTLDRAKVDMNVRTIRGPGKQWYWQLSDRDGFATHPYVPQDDFQAAPAAPAGAIVTPVCTMVPAPSQGPAEELLAKVGRGPEPEPEPNGVLVGSITESDIERLIREAKARASLKATKTEAKHG